MGGSSGCRCDGWGKYNYMRNRSKANNDVYDMLERIKQALGGQKPPLGLGPVLNFDSLF